MQRDEFKAFVESTLEGVICFAEEFTGKKLERHYCFRWFVQSERPVCDDIAQYITKRLFIDEDHIYPCVDIGVGDILSDGTLIIQASVAGYEPRPFGKNWQGKEGPFIHIIGQVFIDKIKAGIKSL